MNSLVSRITRNILKCHDSQPAFQGLFTNISLSKTDACKPRLVSTVKPRKPLNIKVDTSSGLFNPKHKTTSKPRYWERDPKTMATEDWLTVGDGYKVLPWAISGVESCVVVTGSDINIAFDMGYAHHESVKCQNVFISHGHADHVSGILAHAAKRSLYNMKPASYHVPSHLIPPLSTIAEAASSMNGKNIPLKLLPLDVGQECCLPGGLRVRPFPTVHRVASQGYLVYRVKRQLKPQYKGQASNAIGDLVKGGVDVHDVQEIAEIAYTGDTTFDVFRAPTNPDLLRVKLLITEATYVDHENKGGVATVQKARDRGHIHMQEFVDNANLFKQVHDIVLLHFSDKYSSRYVEKQADALIPHDIRHQFHMGLTLKKKFEHKKEEQTETPKVKVI